MSNLLPISVLKEEAFKATGDTELFRFDTDRLTKPEQDLVNKHVEFRLYFGVHGTEAENYLAIEKAFDDFDVEDTIMCFENSGYSVIGEHEMRAKALKMPSSERMRTQRQAILESRKSHNGNYLSSMNAFSYAQAFSIANGYDVRFADLDAWESWHWTHYIKTYGNADNDPLTDESVDHLLNEDWKDLSLVEATSRSKEITDRSTMLIPDADGNNFIVYRWGEYHKLREEAVVKRLKTIGLEEATRIENDCADPIKIALFFGAAHTRGIEERMRNQGLKFNSISLNDIHTDDKQIDQPPLDPLDTLEKTRALQDAASDILLDGQSVRAFFANWLRVQLYAVYGPNNNTRESMELLHEQVAATLHQVDELSFDSICEMYSQYGAYLKWHEDESEGQSVLETRIRKDIRAKDNPAKVLEMLINNMIRDNGAELTVVLDSFRNNKSNSAKRLFGHR